MPPDTPAHRLQDSGAPRAIHHPAHLVCPKETAGREGLAALAEGGPGWQGEGPRLTGEPPRQDAGLGRIHLRAYIIYQRAEGDRLGWSGLLTRQLLSVFIELDAWASGPQHSDFQMGRADSDTGGEWGYDDDWNCF